MSRAFAQEGRSSKAERLFALQIQPLLRDKCLGCHGMEPDKLKGGFDVRSRQAVLRGGESFADEVLVPGKADASYLLAMVRRTEADFEMPPKEADKLTQQQTGWIRDWIDGGAPWPNAKRIAEIYEQHATGVTVKTSGGLSDEWTNRKYKPQDLWAYQSVVRPRVAKGVNAVDHFIDQRLTKLEIQPAPAADRHTLIRRATFDLLGLPPTSEQLERFAKDPQDDTKAFADLVDRLLASSHYGEHWGRHWLDVVRYSDSSGFANDWQRPNAWRYRDYVIRAFNADLPYDQFIRQQIAGDELDSDSSEMKIAVGFLRMGPWEHTGMSVAKVTRQQFLDDVTDSVGQVFLAHPLQCCRCHDHKFDPLPTRDYYSIQAVFATTQFAEVDAAWLADENRSAIGQDEKYLRKQNDANQRMLAGLSASKRKTERDWFKDHGLPYKTLDEALKAGAPKKDLPATDELKTPEDFGLDRIGRKWQQRFPWQFDRYRPIALSVYNGKTRSSPSRSARIRHPADPLAQGRLEKTAILTGGDVFSPGEPVNPGVLSAVSDEVFTSVDNSVAGRRTALARWIASGENKLTARVMANRIWHYHFGRGIAGNPNNFGMTGKKPTHPRLLDWLASEFVANGWSIKHLHRVIVNSQAYRRSSTHPMIEAVKEKDPRDETYAAFRPRRLTAEELRDAMLVVSGELNRQLGGIPCRPNMNLEAALQPRMIMGTFAPSYVPNPTPAERNRRSVYAENSRGHRDPFLETFNQPGSDKSCEMRDSSTVSTQALTLLNSETAADRALAFAAMLLKIPASDETVIQRAFLRAFGREASAVEVKSVLAHWRKMAAVQSNLNPKPRKWPTEVVRRANDENTGKPFTFTERLFVYDDYVPDLQPSDVDARTRGLADVCLMLLNTNEFIYVY